jgi:hypothetical protein
LALPKKTKDETRSERLARRIAMLLVPAFFAKQKRRNLGGWFPPRDSEGYAPKRTEKFRRSKTRRSKRGEGKTSER